MKFGGSSFFRSSSIKIQVPFLSVFCNPSNTYLLKPPSQTDKVTTGAPEPPICTLPGEEYLSIWLVYTILDSELFLLQALKMLSSCFLEFTDATYGGLMPPRDV